MQARTLKKATEVSKADHSVGKTRNLFRVQYDPELGIWGGQDSMVTPELQGLMDMYVPRYAPGPCRSHCPSCDFVHWPLIRQCTDTAAGNF